MVAPEGSLPTPTLVTAGLPTPLADVAAAGVGVPLPTGSTPTGVFIASNSGQIKITGTRNVENPTAKWNASQTRKGVIFMQDDEAAKAGSQVGAVKRRQQATVRLGGNRDVQGTGKPPVKVGVGRSACKVTKKTVAPKKPAAREKDLRQDLWVKRAPAGGVQALGDNDLRVILNKAFDEAPKYEEATALVRRRDIRRFGLVKEKIRVKSSKLLRSGHVKLLLTGGWPAKILPRAMVEKSDLERNVPGLLDRTIPNWPRHVLTFKKEHGRSVTKTSDIGQITFNNKPSQYLLFECEIAIIDYCKVMFEDDWEAFMVPTDKRDTQMLSMKDSAAKYGGKTDDKVIIYANAFAAKGKEVSPEEEIFGTSLEDGNEGGGKGFKNRPTITKLNADNFGTWRTQMGVLLETINLWDTVLEKPKPGRDSWREIMLAVDESQVGTIETTKDGVKAWEALAAFHEKSGLANVLTVLRKFFTTKFEGGSLEKHCSEITATQRKLQRLGHKLDDTIVIAVLLNSLPNKYQPLVYAWDAIGDKLELEQVISKLVNLPTEEDESIQGRGLAAKQNRGQKFDLSKARCFKCGKYGHLKRDCEEENTEKGNSAKTSKTWGLSAAHAEVEQEEWILDSGASQHLTGSKQSLMDLVPNNSVRVTIADGTELKATHVGKLEIEGIGTVDNVFYTPGLETNMLSIGKLSENGYKIAFEKDKCSIRGRGGLYECQKDDGMYKVYACAAKTQQRVSLNEAHELLGHVNIESIKEMAQRNVGATSKVVSPGHIGNWKVDLKSPVEDCKICLEAKLVRTKMPKESTSQTKGIGELIHSDLWGPAQEESDGKHRYFVTFIDDYSKYGSVFLLRTKDETIDAFKHYVKLFKVQMGKDIKTIRTDNGGEYISGSFAKLCKEFGIVHQTTTPSSSFQNGVAERKNRTLVEGAKALLVGAKMDIKYWNEAVTHMNMLRNVILSRGEAITPFEKFFGRKPDYTNIFKFGQTVFAYKHDQKKLDSTGEEGKYVGKDSTKKAIRVLVQDKVKSTRDFRLYQAPHDSPSDKGKKDDNVSDEESSEESVTDDESTDNGEEDLDRSMYFEIESDNDEEVLPETPQVPEDFVKESKYQSLNSHIDPSNIIEGKRVRYPAKETGMAASVKISVKEALKSKDWKAAMDAEMQSQMENNTWTLVPRPIGTKVLRTHWIFALKTLQDNLIKHKARLVVGGNKQEFGIDYKETFAPVVKYQTLRLLLALATILDLEVHQMDFVTAFLNSLLKEVIYVEQPPGYKQDGEDLVCLLHKTLYGLKQSPRQWNEKFIAIMKELGFTPITADSSVFVRPGGMIVACYVDDLLILDAKVENINEFKAKIMKTYKMKDLGEMKSILGMEWQRDRENRTSFLSQEKYTLAVLERFNMLDAKPVTTPGVASTSTSPSKALPNAKEYMEACGSLSYLQNCTRPDITYSVGMICRDMQNPTEENWVAVKRILRYLKGTTSFGIEYKKVSDNDLNVVGYADADWAGDQSSRKSTSGYIFVLGNGAVSWGSKKQSVVALSTVEAEYISGSLGVQEAIWERKLLEELGFNTKTPVLMQDNQGTIALAKNPIAHARTKHIDIRHYFMKSSVMDGSVTLKYCETQEMTADMMTKYLTKQSHERHVKAAGLKPKM